MAEIPVLRIFLNDREIGTLAQLSGDRNLFVLAILLQPFVLIPGQSYLVFVNLLGSHQYLKGWFS